MSEVALDHVFIMNDGGRGKYLINARCTFSGWVEAMITEDTSAAAVVKFLEKEVFPRHGPISTFIADNGTVSSQAVRTCIESHGGKLKLISAYNPRGNAVVERGHGPLIKALGKLRYETKLPWTRLLPQVLWADRAAVRTSTGHSAFFLLYGRDPDLSDTSNYYANLSPEDTITQRVKQMNFHKKELEEIRLRTERVRERGRELADLRRGVQEEHLIVGDLVLVWRTRLDNDFSHKLEPRWDGPYQLITLLGPSCEIAMLNGGPNKWISRRFVKKYSNSNDLHVQGVSSPHCDDLPMDIDHPKGTENHPLPVSRSSITDQTSAKHTQTLARRTEEQKTTPVSQLAAPRTVPTNTYKPSDNTVIKGQNS